MGCGASSASSFEQTIDPNLYPWLKDKNLEIYYDKLISEGYTHMDFIRAAYPEDLNKLFNTLKMTESHMQIFIQSLKLPDVILATPVSINSPRYL